MMYVGGNKTRLESIEWIRQKKPKVVDIVQKK